MSQREPNRPDLRWLRVAGQCSFIPVYLALYPIAFYFIGTWLDDRLGTEWLKNAFLFLGLISGFRQTFFLIRNLLREQERQDRGPS